MVRPDLNLRELCKEVGISHSHLSLVLLGRRNPSLKVARRLAEVLGISLDDLAAYLELYADQVKLVEEMDLPREIVWEANTPERKQ